MTSKTLTKEALEVIENYKSLPELGIPCPYFINVGYQKGTRAEMGKGTPSEIAQELKDFPNKKVGVDCSGIVYHILDAECGARGFGPLEKFAYYPKHWLKTLLGIDRPAENISTEIFHDERNSKKSDLYKVLPGDIITMFGKSEKKDSNHILLVHQVDYDDNGTPTTMHYTHSRKPDGIRQGTINIRHPISYIIEQEWRDENDLARAQSAHTLTLRHPIWLK